MLLDFAAIFPENIEEWAIRIKKKYRFRYLLLRYRIIIIKTIAFPINRPAMIKDGIATS